MSDKIILSEGFNMDLMMPEDEVLASEEEKIVLPRLAMTQGMSAAAQEAGARVGYFNFSIGDQYFPLPNAIHVHLLDFFPGRTMWAYGPDGKRLRGDDAPKSPVCGSNNGVSARDTYLPEAREGNVLQFVDWRTNAKVNIFPDQCKNCPLGEWKYLSKDGEKKSFGPPCQETPTYLVFVPEIGSICRLQAGSNTLRQCLHGTTKKSKMGYRPGLKSFYESVKNPTTKVMMVPPKVQVNGHIHYVKLTSKKFEIGGNMVYGFDLSVGDPAYAIKIEGEVVNTEAQLAKVIEKYRASKEEYRNRINESLEQSEMDSDGEKAEEETVLHPF